MKTRQSNLELLRIISMIMVVFLHANYFSLGYISSEEVVSDPGNSLLKIFLEQLCVVCVNVFVLISGWFGIKPSLKGLANILFQVFFYGGIIFFVGWLMHLPISKNSILDVFLFRNAYWFVSAYIILYLFSPVLNSFVEKSSRQNFLIVLFCFFSAEFVFGGVIDSGRYEYGYSAISFFGLYLLARYLRLFPNRFVSFGCKKNFALYLSSTIIPTLLCFSGEILGGHSFGATCYNSPFVIAAAVFLLLAFADMQFHSEFVNWVACSVFPIYLVHQHPIVVQHFRSLMHCVYGHTTVLLYILFVIMFTGLLTVFCVVTDKLRILLWNLLCRKGLNDIFESVSTRFTRSL